MEISALTGASQERHLCPLPQLLQIAGASLGQAARADRLDNLVPHRLERLGSVDAFVIHAKRLLGRRLEPAAVHVALQQLRGSDAFLLCLPVQEVLIDKFVNRFPLRFIKVVTGLEQTRWPLGFEVPQRQLRSVDIDEYRVAIRRAASAVVGGRKYKSSRTEQQCRRKTLHSN